MQKGSSFLPVVVFVIVSLTVVGLMSLSTYMSGDHFTVDFGLDETMAFAVLTGLAIAFLVSQLPTKASRRPRSSKAKNTKRTRNKR